MKLFVGQIPKTMEEDDIRPIMEEYGIVKDIKVIRDKVNNQHKGCCFVTYETQQQADFAIAALHNVRILSGVSTPMQVKYAEGESTAPNKLFVGMLTKSTTEQDLSNIFVPFGEVEEVAILRGPNNVGKGCGFVRYKNRDSALKAISALNGAYKLEGAPGNIIVKFADTEKFKQQKKAQQAQLHVHPPPNKMLDPASAHTLYQINPLLANIAASPLAATLLPTIAAALGIPSGVPPPPPPAPVHAPGNSPPPPPPPPYHAYPYLPSPAGPYALPGYPPPGFPPPPPAPAPDLQINAPQREGPSGCNLFIYHLPQEYTDSSLSQLFAGYGTVLSAKVFVDKVTMQSKCFGFVSYDKPESAAAAIAALHGLALGNKRLKVSLKKADSSRPGAPY